MIIQTIFQNCRVIHVFVTKKNRIWWNTLVDWSINAWFETVATRCKKYSIVVRTTWKFITSTRRQTMWIEWEIEFDTSKWNWAWINCEKWYMTWLIKRIESWKRCCIFQQRSFLSFRDWAYETISFEKSLNIISFMTLEIIDRWMHSRDCSIIWSTSEFLLNEIKVFTNTKSKNERDWSINFTTCWSRWCNDHENKTRATLNFWSCMNEISITKKNITCLSSSNTISTNFKKFKWNSLFDITEITTFSKLSKWFIVFYRAKWTRCKFESSDWFVRRETRCNNIVSKINIHDNEKSIQYTLVYENWYTEFVWKD